MTKGNDMKKMSLALMASMMLLPVVSFAQAIPQPPASWVAFQQEEAAKQAAFNKQMKDEVDAFLRSHPEVNAYFDQVRAANKARYQAEHQK